MKEGWTYKKLGEVCEIFGRIGFRGYTKSDLVNSPEDGAITLSPSNIIDGEMNYGKCSYITWAKYEESPEIKIYPGDILLVKTASVGKTALVKYLPHKATINPQFVVLKKISINNEYLSYYLKSEKAQNFIWSIAKGAAAQTVSQKNLAEMIVPNPTLYEQKRIVSRLDAAFSHIDELKANAEKQLSEARALFQKSLAKAMEPKEGWKENTLKEVSTISGDYGLSVSSKPFDGIRYLRITDITDSGELNDDKASAEVDDPKKQEELEEGDILFARTGATVGKTLVYNKKYGKCLFAGYLIRYRLNKSVIAPGFMHYFTHSNEYYDWVNMNQEAAAQPNISAKKYNLLLVKYPPLSEQQRIVKRLDALSAHVHELEENQKKIISECDALKQALLRKVFE